MEAPVPVKSNLSTAEESDTPKENSSTETYSSIANPDSHSQSSQQTKLDELCSTSGSSKLKRDNSQRRLRIPTEDHRMFLAGLTEDILPYLDECRQINNSSDVDVIPVRKVSKEYQYQPIASTSNKHSSVLENGNSYAIVKPNESCPGSVTNYFNLNFLHNNNNALSPSSVDMSSDSSVFSSPEPGSVRRKAYNSPKKFRNNNSTNCAIV